MRKWQQETKQRASWWWVEEGWLEVLQRKVTLGELEEAQMKQSINFLKGRPTCHPNIKPSGMRKVFINSVVLQPRRWRGEQLELTAVTRDNISNFWSQFYTWLVAPSVKRFSQYLLWKVQLFRSPPCGAAVSWNESTFQDWSLLSLVLSIRLESYKASRLSEAPKVNKIKNIFVMATM